MKDVTLFDAVRLLIAGEFHCAVCVSSTESSLVPQLAVIGSGGLLRQVSSTGG
jgi:hypothetical protein